MTAVEPGAARDQADDVDRRHGDDHRSGIPRDLEAVLRDPDQLADAFARAWFKLLHRDMGPAIRYVGPQRGEELPWQDNVPAHSGAPIGLNAEIAELKSTILDSGLTIDQLVKTAWASASTYRRQPTTGAMRIRLEPQRGWDVNNKLEEIQGRVQRQGWRQVSLADLIVLVVPPRSRPGPRLPVTTSAAAVHPGWDRRRPGRRRRFLRLPRAHGRRLPELCRQAGRGADRAPAHRQGVHAQPLGSRDDRPRRRAPGARQQLGLRGSTVCSRTVPVS